MKKNIMKKRNIIILSVIILFIWLSVYFYMSWDDKNEIEFIDLWESETNTLSTATGSLPWFE